MVDARGSGCARRGRRRQLRRDRPVAPRIRLLGAVTSTGVDVPASPTCGRGSWSTCSATTASPPRGRLRRHRDRRPRPRRSAPRHLPHDGDRARDSFATRPEDFAPDAVDGGAHAIRPAIESHVAVHRRDPQTLVRHGRPARRPGCVAGTGGSSGATATLRCSAGTTCARCAARGSTLRCAVDPDLRGAVHEAVVLAHDRDRGSMRPPGSACSSGMWCSCRGGGRRTDLRRWRC